MEVCFDLPKKAVQKLLKEYMEDMSSAAELEAFTLMILKEVAQWQDFDWADIAKFANTQNDLYQQYTARPMD